jgi:hypothetical protein
MLATQWCKNGRLGVCGDRFCVFFLKKKKLLCVLALSKKKKFKTSFSHQMLTLKPPFFFTSFLSLFCRVLPCFDTFSPCFRYVFAMFLGCFWYVFDMFLPCFYHVFICFYMFLLCFYHVFTMKTPSYMGVIGAYLYSAGTVTFDGFSRSFEFDNELKQVIAWVWLGWQWHSGCGCGSGTVAGWQWLWMGGSVAGVFKWGELEHY